MYEALTNKRPFEEENLVDLMYAIQRKPFTPLRTVNPQVTPKLEAIINKCLTKSPDLRYRAVSEVREALLAPAEPRLVTTQFTPEPAPANRRTPPLYCGPVTRSACPWWRVAPAPGCPAGPCPTRWA